MKAKIIKSHQIKEKGLGIVKVKEIFNNPKVEEMSAAIIEIKGKNKKVRNKKCHHFYFVLKGGGVFNINNKNHKVSKGDLIFIPKDAVYSDLGNMTLLSFAHPRFTAEQVEYL